VKDRCRLEVGATKLEFVVVVVVFGLLAAILLARINAIQADAERTEVDLTVRNIRVGIQLAIGERIMRGEEHRIDEVARASPLEFLDHRPRGLVDDPEVQQAGQWTYDPRQRELIYLPRSPEAFDQARRLRWRYTARVDTTGKTVGASLIVIN
jgi:general secretion pathway protein G